MRPLRPIAGLLLALPLASTAAGLTAVDWNAQGRWHTTLTAAPKRPAEACTALKQGERVRWHWTAAAPLAFNIHYHLGKEVVMPVQADASAGEGTLEVLLTQTYCWMWRGTADAQPIQLTLERLTP